MDELDRGTIVTLAGHASIGSPATTQPDNE